MKDPNFIDTIDILESNKVPYWLCHGTLLGIVRDKNLIPWDDDIDIAIFKSDIDFKKINKIFQKRGFTNTRVSISGSIHFRKRGGRNVDINFYQKIDKSKHGVIWKLPKKSIFFRILHIIVNDTEYLGKNTTIIKILKKIKPFFRIIIFLLDIWKLTYVTKGYTVPSNLLEQFIYIKNDGMKLRVPKENIAICRYTYGDSWNQQIKNFDWEEDSPSTKVFK